jgi:hypothetical protein
LKLFEIVLLAGFGSDGGGVAVTGIDECGRRKGEKTIEGIDELVDVSSGQVRSSIAHTEKRIAGDEDIRLEKQAHTALGMSGRMDDLEIEKRPFRLP